VITLTPSAAAVLGFATRLVMTLLATPAVNVTLVVAVAPPPVPVMVLASALVDAKVAVNTPELFVVPELGVKVLLDPELLSATA
jgi:hypothetical protein